MVIYSALERWEKLSTFQPSNNNDQSIIAYFICIKRLFCRPKILGTNIKIKKGIRVEDRSVMRFGYATEDMFSNTIFLHQSKFLAFFTPKTAFDLLKYKEFYDECKNLSFFKRHKRDLKYLFHHLELAQVEINPNDYILYGRIGIVNSTTCFLTKTFKVLDIAPILKFTT